jgi:hypothetical protein
MQPKWLHYKNQILIIEFLATVPVIGLDLSSAEYFGQIKARLEREGNILADADLLIAAITLACGASPSLQATGVTMNASTDYGSRIGFVAIISTKGNETSHVGRGKVCTRSLQRFKGPYGGIR